MRNTNHCKTFVVPCVVNAIRNRYAIRLLEAWRNLVISAADLLRLGDGKRQGAPLKALTISLSA
ncbi:MAG: hypothetical protein MUO77_19085 [Anaerolineales bacterium]|nr:hypothetical protein [Anaerolineales bacterium]